MIRGSCPAPGHSGPTPAVLSCQCHGRIWVELEATVKVAVCIRVWKGKAVRGIYPMDRNVGSPCETWLVAGLDLSALDPKGTYSGTTGSSRLRTRHDSLMDPSLGRAASPERAVPTRLHGAFSAIAERPVGVRVGRALCGSCRALGRSGPAPSGTVHSIDLPPPVSAVSFAAIADVRSPRLTTRSSAIAEGQRDASCQLKSCQLPRNSAETTYTTSPDQIDGVKLEI